jgi:membrane protein YqaA with SNARE-associated domain
MKFIVKVLLAPLWVVWFLIRLVFLPFRYVFKLTGWLLRFVSHNLLGGVIGGALGYLIGRKMTESQQAEPEQPSDKPADTGTEEPGHSQE